MTSDVNQLFSSEEIRGIREGLDGVKRAIPARFYHDEAIYQYEVEHLLKKNWLCVGRWDQVEKPGDYFTTRMWDESIVVVRDKEKQLHALINVCQHRWSQVVEDGSGNTSMFMCPYHRWTYNLDGRLRGMSVQDIPGVDKKKCGLPKLRVEEWHGFIFINFDLEAKPLAPQLEVVDHYLAKYQVGTYRKKVAVEYQTSWNWKFSFETSYEGYHHIGLHHDRIYHIVPSANTTPGDFGEACGSYIMWPVDDAPTEFSEPFGNAPGADEDDLKGKDHFIALYPNLVVFLTDYQCTYIIVEHQSVDSNHAATCQSFAPWVLEKPGSEEVIAEILEDTKGVQREDSFGCSMLQKGITSKTNTGSMIHPLEEQLNHYHNWYMDQLLNSRVV